MDEKSNQLNILLKRVVDEIRITPSMLDKAESSYKAVRQWLIDGIPDATITPQGSINLGTTIKPVSDIDDYDIDLVCLLKKSQNYEAKTIKHKVGNRLKENKRYLIKINEEGEGKRCWKMQYDEFHMDILPCVPKTEYIEPFSTEIRLTHKISSNVYEDRFSNPYGYKKWFESRMKDILKIEKDAYAKKKNTRVEDVPTFRVCTPLQMAIQLLKRHRDICFEHDSDNSPISVIITTLAAKAYNGEENLYLAICNILNHMEEYIEIRDGIYWIANPVSEEENFADKWQIYPKRKDAFYGWLKKAKRDFITLPMNTAGIDSIASELEKILGEAPVKRAVKKYADDMYKARTNGELYVSGLTGGLTTKESSGSTLVKKHNFYGK
ncbi:nucleotidyltransferase domain-containing protein [Catenibacterium mitsuokai]|uniref:nucleotidyltransferase domain-containing protein n=1 Tax=Catenibacterium mitsuokai TaxID=100886 RepID=UPI003F898812